MAAACTKHTPTSPDPVLGAMIELAGTFYHNFKSWSTLLNFFFKPLFQIIIQRVNFKVLLQQDPWLLSQPQDYTMYETCTRRHSYMRTYVQLNPTSKSEDIISQLNSSRAECPASFTRTGCRTF
ncbi:hypothetical protein IAS59_003486 [Cryptococcus gattii]